MCGQSTIRSQRSEVKLNRWVMACLLASVLFGSVADCLGETSQEQPLWPEREQALQPKDSFRECKDCPELVVVPKGSFLMGSSDNEAFRLLVGELTRDPIEILRHKVTIARPVAISRFPVTFDDWDACVADGGCDGYRPWDNGWGRGRRPVINVSWNDAQAYVTWLSRHTGKPYRLLSETEFEYVARAGSETAYPWGAELGCDSCDSQQHNGKSVPAGLAVNTFRLYPMAENPCGRDLNRRLPPCNVWEWVEDCDHGNHKGHGNYDDAPTDGSAWTNGDCSRRVIRGGVWHDFPPSLPKSYRSGFTTDYRNYFLGFRVARILKNASESAAIK